ncbi:MAG: DsrE family protein [Gammaproteobacteria bacterium]
MATRFYLEVRSSPEAPSAPIALSLAEAIMQSTHQLSKVFFTGAGAKHALQSRSSSALLGSASFWEQCANEGAELLVCASALQRLTRAQPDARLDSCFIPCGLAELMAPLPNDTRLICFNER